MAPCGPGGACREGVPGRLDVLSLVVWPAAEGVLTRTTSRKISNLPIAIPKHTLMSTSKESHLDPSIVTRFSTGATLGALERADLPMTRTKKLFAWIQKFALVLGTASASAHMRAMTGRRLSESSIRLRHTVSMRLTSDSAVGQRSSEAISRDRPRSRLRGGGPLKAGSGREPGGSAAFATERAPVKSCGAASRWPDTLCGRTAFRSLDCTQLLAIQFVLSEKAGHAEIHARSPESAQIRRSNQTTYM